MNEPKISVIMGVYNQWNKEWLDNAVDSILSQTMTDFEFIIWNDGSDEAVTSYIESLKNRDSRIVIVGKDENHGLAYSLNSCIRMAKGMYIARMDDDDKSLPNRLEMEYEFLETHKEYSWCGSAADLFDENGIWGRRIMKPVPVADDFLKYSPFIHPTVMFRKSIFAIHEGYAEEDEMLRCEDYELFMRLYKSGFRGYNIEDVLFQYREAKASYKKRKFVFRINEAKVRYRNFKVMGLLNVKGWLYVLRPIIGGLVPNFVISFIKRVESNPSKIE